MGMSGDYMTAVEEGSPWCAWEHLFSVHAFEYEGGRVQCHFLKL